MKIAICSTRNWYFYIVVLIYALFKHNDIEKIYLFIEDDNIPYLKDKRIEFININNTKEYINKESPNYNTRYSKMSYIRCYFSKLINEDKILYIDADAIVIDNIQELWDIDMTNYAIAGVKEPGKWDRHLRIEGMDDNYINSGIMLMNLDYIRKHKLDNRMIELLNNNYYEYPDQDVINIVCKGKIKYISNIYNSTETTGIVSNAKIIHYIRERKGWIKESPRSEIWFSYYNEILKGGKNMIKVEVTEGFTLGQDNRYRFADLKNIIRKGQDKIGELFVGDIFECTEEMAKYLTGENGLHRAFVKVIEIIPEEISEEVVQAVAKAIVEESDEQNKEVKEIVEEIIEESKEEKPKKVTKKKTTKKTTKKQ